MTTEENKYSRRTFIRTVIGGAALAGAAAKLGAFDGTQQETSKAAGMPTRPLGKTGHNICLFSLGGQATLEEDNTEEQSLAIINRAIDLGVNYIDTAAAYGRGISEKYIGKVMESRRNKVYLATKTHDRSYDGSMRLLERSLKQLQTDYLDAWQLHNVRTQQDLDEIFAKDGAIKALEKARDQKIVRFLGITGHYDPLILKEAILQYPFDTILMALNAADRHHGSFIDNLLPTAVERKLGIIAMKVPARGRIFQPGGISTMKQAMGYVLTLPVSTVIVGISTMKELEENIHLARDFKPNSNAEMQMLEDMTKPYFADASWFKKEW